MSVARGAKGARIAQVAGSVTAFLVTLALGAGACLFRLENSGLSHASLVVPGMIAVWMPLAFRGLGLGAWTALGVISLATWIAPVAPTRLPRIAIGVGAAVTAVLLSYGVQPGAALGASAILWASALLPSFVARFAPLPRVAGWFMALMTLAAGISWTWSDGSSLSFSVPVLLIGAMGWGSRFLPKSLVGTFALLAVAVLGTGCGTSKPCAEAGDLSWPTAIRGDRTCYQTRLKDGRVVNHGRYLQRYPDGKVAVEGDFLEGVKHGTWVQYGPNGMRVLEKYFDHGVEKAVATTPPLVPAR
jgi:hypothetical protein